MKENISFRNRKYQQETSEYNETRRETEEKENTIPYRWGYILDMVTRERLQKMFLLLTSIIVSRRQKNYKGTN
jgi:hypothetical protein